MSRANNYLICNAKMGWQRSENLRNCNSFPSKPKPARYEVTIGTFGEIFDEIVGFKRE